MITNYASIETFVNSYKKNNSLIIKNNLKDFYKAVLEMFQPELLG